MPAKTLVVFNPRSRGGRHARRWAQLEKRLRRVLGSLEVQPTGAAGDAVRVAREAVRAGVERIVVAGGATLSDLWLQIHADVSNLPLTLTEVADAPLLGCAILASVGCGLNPDVQTAVDHMVKVARVIEPEPSAHTAYQPFYETYKATYDAVLSMRRGL